MKRTIETYIILFKEDLKIADTCKSVKHNLLNYIGNNDYFSEELSAYFVKENPKAPYIISPTDPSQVAALKKILNALENTEKAVRSIEDLDIGRDRYTAGIVKDAVKISYSAINELYAALQLINQSSTDIQNIVGPHFNKLLPQMALATKALGSFAPEHPEESSGAALADAVKMLPDKKLTEAESMANISNLIYELPHYFEELQKLISTGSSGIANKSITSSQEYHDAMTKKANETQKHLEKINATGSRLSLLITLKNLAALSSDLLNTGAPLTKQAYLDAANQLNDIKHNILPQIIAELEQMEESMGLKPGLLTQPALEQMNTYYTQLAQQVNGIAAAAGVIDSTATMLDGTIARFARRLIGDNKALDVGEKITPLPNLDVMMDDVFVEKRRANQIQRLNEAEFAAQDSSTLDAANRFFSKLESYGTLSKTYCKWSLANISQSEKNALIAEYKQFQSHFASQHPDIDKLIVDALTQPTGSSIVSRLYSSEYKQLWGADHFAQVLGCKERVLTNIKQSTAQAEFTAKLITQTMSQAEKSQQSHLSITAQPFVPLTHSDEENKPPEHYHNQGIAISNQITNLERAQEGVNEFFSYLAKKYPHKNPSFDSLDAADKEALSEAYKKFQPHMLAMKLDSINTRLVNSLTSATPSVPPLMLSDLSSLKTSINSNLTKWVNKSEEDRDAYFDQESDARQEKYQESTLVAKGAELEKKTLFGMLSELRLSKSVDDFLNTKLQTYLKENLSEAVWKELSTENGEQLDVTKIPYLEFHKDSQEVAMYKQLINSVHYMKNGLQQLETLNNHENATTIIGKTRFLISTFNALLININNSSYYIQQAAGNPGLKAIMQEGLQILDPLKNVPLIGDYLKTSEPAAPQQAVEVDVIKAWKDQLAIVESGLIPTKDKSVVAPTSAITPTDVDVSPEPVATPPGKAPSFVQLLAEQLYNIPAELNKLNTSSTTPAPTKDELDAKIKEFVSGLDGLSYGSKSAQKILNTASKLQIQLSEIGKAGREVTMSHLKEIRSEFGNALMEAADNAEFHLGLKPGTYSNMVSERFDTFYNALLVNLPLKSEQEGLVLLTDTTSTQKRLKRENDRLLEVQNDTGAERTREAIFGADYAAFNDIYKTLASMKSNLQDTMDYSNPYENTLMEMQEYIAADYAKIQPLLAAVNPRFGKDFITKHNDESALRSAMEEVVAAHHLINPPSSSFATLKAMLLDSDFENMEDKEQFLQCYKDLQPYLNKIDYNFDLVYFLRELQTPEDFNAALDKIISQEGKLEEIITGLEKGKNLKIALCKERVAHFDDLLNKEEQILGPEKIEAFKDKVFTNHINTNIRTRIEDKIGPHADLFLQHIMPDILAMKPDALKGVTIKHDIQEVISSYIDQHIQAIAQKNISSFKEMMFNNHINNNIKNSLNEELGIFASLFVNKITPEYALKKSEIIAGVGFNKEMESNISSQIDRQTPRVLQKYGELKNAYSELNTILKQITQLIDEEHLKSKDNPCRNEKIALLTSLKNKLSDINNIPEQNTASYLTQLNSEARLSVVSISNYDAITSVYDVLNTLKESIQNEFHGSPQDKAEKIKAISALQAELADTNKDVPTRLNSVVQQLSNTSQNSVLKTSDNFLVGEAFKSQVFENYININIKEQLTAEQGDYAKVFLEQIRPNLMARKAELLKDLPISDIENKIAAKFDVITPGIIEKNMDVKNACMELHNALLQMNRLIEEESTKPKGNPCREEKINVLMSYQALLKNIERVPEHGTLKFLQEQIKDKNKFLTNIKNYDDMIVLHDDLSQMKNYVNSSSESSSEIKAGKIAELSTLQGMLTAPKEASTRLADVKERGLSEECQSTLLKNSDNFFVSLVKSLAKKLFNWQSKDEVVVSSFKQKLNEMKQQSVIATPKEEVIEEAAHSQSHTM